MLFYAIIHYFRYCNRFLLLTFNINLKFSRLYHQEVTRRKLDNKLAKIPIRASQVGGDGGVFTIHAK